MNLTSACSLPNPLAHFSNSNPNPNPNPCVVPFSTRHSRFALFPHRRLSFSRLKAKKNGHSLVSSSSGKCHWLELYRVILIEVPASSLLLLALSVFSLSFSAKLPAALAVVDASGRPPLQEERIEEGQEDVENFEDEQLREEFENWKSKTYALTVLLRLVALQGSVPPAWIKDFFQCQGRRSKLSMQFRGTLEGIFSELLRSTGKVDASRNLLLQLISLLLATLGSILPLAMP